MKISILKLLTDFWWNKCKKISNCWIFIFIPILIKSLSSIINWGKPDDSKGIFTLFNIVAIVGATLITKTNETEMQISGLQALIQYGVQILMSLMFLSFVAVMISLATAAGKRITEVKTIKKIIN